MSSWTLSITDDHFQTLDRTVQAPADHTLALRHAPLIRFDVREPFLPSVVGYTVFRQDGPSPSFPRTIALQAPAVTAIEYAIWWDWDIEHLYELEHLWVYLNSQEHVVAGEASWHGDYHLMIDEQGQLPLSNGRLIVHSEPGKHAFAPSPQWLLERAPTTVQSCGTRAGSGGVHVTPLFEGIITSRTPLNNRLTHTYLERHTFEPAYDFSLVFDLRTLPHIPWPSLSAWIPERVSWWAEALERAIPRGERRVLRIAHRGASAYAQENSTASLRTAAELGADMVEVDLRLTADNMPVIAHDATLSRTYGKPGAIEELTLDELRAATAGAGLEPIMTFAEVVEVCQSLRLGLYLDIKNLNEAAIASVFETLDRHAYLRGTIFGSFRPDWIAEIKAYRPDATTSILFSSTHIDPVALAQAVRCDYVHPCWERFPAPSQYLTEDWIERVRAADLGIVCWHEERLAEIIALKRLGVDAICSDRPDLLKVSASHE